MRTPVLCWSGFDVSCKPVQRARLHMRMVALLSNSVQMYMKRPHTVMMDLGFNGNGRHGQLLQQGL